MAPKTLTKSSSPRAVPAKTKAYVTWWQDPRRQRARLVQWAGVWWWSAGAAPSRRSDRSDQSDQSDDE